MENTNNKPQPQIPEGESFLLIRRNVKTGEFACVHSNIFDALMLLSLAQTAMELEKKKMLQPLMPGSAVPQIAVPAVRLPNFDALRKKQG